MENVLHCYKYKMYKTLIHVGKIILGIKHWSDSWDQLCKSQNVLIGTYLSGGVGRLYLMLSLYKKTDIQLIKGMGWEGSQAVEDMMLKMLGVLQPRNEVASMWLAEASKAHCENLIVYSESRVKHFSTGEVHIQL